MQRPCVEGGVWQMRWGRTAVSMEALAGAGVGHECGERLGRASGAGGPSGMHHRDATWAELCLQMDM